MFDFLKKKLKEGIEKITKSVKKEKEEVSIEKVEEAVEEAREIKEERKEVEHKEEILKEKRVKLTPEVEEAIEKPEYKLKGEKEKPKEGFIAKIRRKITEKEISEDDVKDILWDLQLSLIESDVATETAEKIVNDLKSNLVGKSIKKGEVEKTVKESFRKSIVDILNVDELDFLKKVKSKKPFLILFLGFNGSGKTTTVARIGHLLQKQGLKCVFAAADTWRAASIEQLEEHGRRLEINVIKHKYGADPAAIIFDSVKYAEAHHIDVVLADTAGRSHANVNLIDELKKITRVNKPDLKILVLDALTGNDIYDQCKMFNDAVGVDALIITKADVYEKGGAALSASHTIGKPTLFLGVGQNYEDLIKFDPKKIAENLLS